MRAAILSGFTLLFMLVSAVSFTGCQKEYSIENPFPPGTLAKGSLKDTSNNCLPDSVHGTWYNGVTPGDTNFVEIKVRVTAVGVYKISTDLQNGVILSDSGAFNTVGLTTIRLKATGTFINPTTTFFNVSFDSTSCQFALNVKDSTGTGLGGNPGGGNPGGGGTGTVGLNQWQFTAAGHTYMGNIMSAQFSTILGGNLILIGSMLSLPAGSTPDTVFGIGVQFPSTNLVPGTYTTADAGTNFSLYKLPSGDIIFAANATASPPTISIVISSYDATTKIVSGTFTGNSYNISSQVVPISNGAFKTKVPLP